MLNILDPRGIRNNNPGNIRLSKTLWQGQKPAPEQSDQDFAEFTTPLYGLRALMKTLLTYYLKYNLDTVRSLINRYAPPHENDTGSYISEVSRALNVRHTDKIDVTSKQTLVALTQARSSCKENGQLPAGKPTQLATDPVLYDQAANSRAAGGGFKMLCRNYRDWAFSRLFILPSNRQLGRTDAAENDQMQTGAG